MSKRTLLSIILGLTSVNVAVTGYNTYNSHNLLERNHEEAEARMDELEGTLRGHIGLIEESLERTEGMVAKMTKGESGWGKGMGARAEELYGQRGRDEKKK